MPDDAKRSAQREKQAEDRKALVDRLREENADDLADPLEACGQPFHLTCICCGESRETTTSCNKRWCPSCAPVLSAVRYARWVHAIDRLQWPLFVTFTIPNSEDPECLRELKSHWQKFRRRKIWRDQVKGGVGTFEITNKGNGWHPHIHAVVDCRWLAVHVPEPRPQDSKEVKEQKCELAQRELSRAWADQIGHEHGVVWVRRVYGTGVVREVLKYAVKSSDLLEAQNPIAPMLRVLRQTRTLSGFGSLHPLPSPDEEEPFQVVCEGCGEPSCFMPSEIVDRLFAGHRTGVQAPAIPAASKNQ